MAPQRAGNQNSGTFLVRQNPQKLILLLFCSLVMISCADALPATQGVLPKSRLRLYNIDAATTKTLSAQISLPLGTVNNLYSGSIVASGGAAPYSYVVSAGSLPSGLSLDPMTGTVSGTPTLAGTNNFKFTVTDSNGASFHNHAQIVIGSINTAATAITITVNPTSATLASGATQQFSDTVQGTSNTAVTWSASAGTITPGGLFTAPTVSSNTTVTVTATSAANGAQSSATVAVGAATATATPISVAVSPNPASISSGASQQFSASVQGTSNAAVSWQTTAGTISSTGLYTAPVVSSNTNVTVRAISMANTNVSGNANVAVSPSPSSPLSACSAAPVISNVAHTLSSDSRSITITWDTDIPADTAVQWGDNDHFGGPTSGPIDTVSGKTTGHTYTITGLWPLYFSYGFYPRSRCIDSSGPSLNTNYWASASFFLTAPLPTGPFQWAPFEVGPHYTFPGYPLYFEYVPEELRTPTGAGVNWNYTVTVSVPAGWTFTIDSCGAACPGFPVTGNSFTITEYNGITLSFLIHLNIPSGTAPGTYTVSEHLVDNTFGTAPQDSTWTINVLNPTTDAIQQGAPPTSFPPIPCQHATSLQANGAACPSSWDSLVNLAFTNYASIPSGQICTDNTTLPNAFSMAATADSWFYDGIRGYQQALKYTGNSSFNTCLTDAIAYLRDRFYLYTATLPSNQQNWGMGLATFTRGLYADYLASGNSSDLAAITDLVTLAPGSDSSMYMVMQNSQREVSYRLEAETVWAQLGNTNRADMLNRALAMTIGTMDESCVSQNNSSGPLPSSVEPIFIGVAADSLIYYYNNGHQSDVRIPWAIKKCADWLWNNSWVGQPRYAGGPDHYWSYLTDVLTMFGSDADYRGLNPLIVPVYAWLFKYTGNASIPGSDGSQCYGTPGQPCTYLQAGDAAFSSAMATSGNLTTWGWMWGGKSYTQTMRWGFDYLNWRNGQ